MTMRPASSAAARCKRRSHWTERRGVLALGETGDRSQKIHGSSDRDRAKSEAGVAANRDWGTIPDNTSTYDVYQGMLFPCRVPSSEDLNPSDQEICRYARVGVTRRSSKPDSNHRSRRERGGLRERPLGRPSRLARRPCLMTPSSLSVRHLSSATAERPFTRAGPMVRIRFPPAASQQSFGLLLPVSETVHLSRSCSTRKAQQRS